jgi:subtilase family serine protease
MNSDRISFALRLICLAFAIIAARVPDCVGEEMVPLTDHSITVPEVASWTQPESRDLTLWLWIRLKIDKEADDKFVAGLQDPTSPYYGRWLRPGQAGIDQARRIFGPPPDRVLALRDWLTSQGFDHIQEGSEMFGFSGSVATVEKAFATEIVASPDGCHADKIPPQIPARLADVVESIRGLGNCGDNYIALPVYGHGSSTSPTSPPPESKNDD